jgi:hypothetical protein
MGLTSMEDELAFLVEDGEVEVQADKAAGKQYRVVFGKAGEAILMREGRAGVSTTAEGVKVVMLMGRATIQQGDQETLLETGASFKLQIGEGTIVGRESLATTLKDARRVSRIRAPGKRRFARPKSASTELAPGTVVKTPRKGSVEITDPAGGRVMLAPSSQARFEGTFQSGGDREGVLRLETGSARVQLSREGSGGASQEVITPITKLAIRARGRTADVTVTSRPKATRVDVHAGKVAVNTEKETIEVAAGQSLVVDKKGLARKLAQASHSRIRAPEGRRTQVFFDRKIQDANLVWKSQSPAEQVVLEVSPSPSFQPLWISEPVSGNSFALTGIRSPVLHWRLRRRVPGKVEVVGQTGVLQVKRDPTARRLKSGKLTNVVPDTGIQTTILFQGKVPALTFTWKKRDKATDYLVRIYSEDDLDKPIHEKAAASNRLVLPAGKLREGTYFWYQAARGPGGEEIHTSQMNKLVVVFDNAAPLLKIDSPRPGQKPKGNTVTVSGMAAKGSRLSVNGVPIDLSSDGRFHQTLPGIKRGKMLLFELKQRGRGTVYFLRHLGR